MSEPARGEVGEGERSREPVLVADVRRDRVAQRLFVAEHEAPPVGVTRTGDPLEPGERRAGGHTGRGRDPIEQARRHDRPGHDAVVATRGREHVRAEQCPDLVTGEHPPAARRRYRGRQSVGVGVVGEHEVGAVPAGEIEREVEHTRFLGVGERRGGEVGVGLRLRVHHDRRREAGPFPERGEHVEADTVHRRVDDPQITRAASRHDGGRGVEIRVERVVTERFDPVGFRCVRDLGGRPGRRDRGADLGVDRRDDLRTAAVVDLVAVVGGRVVTRGHHHAGGGAEVANCVRGDGRRPRARREPHRYAGRGEHTRGVAREHVGEMAVVEADHHAARGGVGRADPMGEAGRRGAHHRDVHAVRTGAERAPQSRGPERQSSREARCERVVVARVQQGLELGS